MYESQISFTLDTVCPWTYLGKKRLDEALAQVRSSPDLSSKAAFTLKFLPYQLYPNFPTDPPEGVDKHAWYRDAKFAGSEERTAVFEQVMSAHGADRGIKFSFRGVIGNTLEAHRVVRYFQETKGPETANRLVDALYRMYFEEEQHPSSDATLLEACAEAGIGEEEAKRVVVEDRSEGLTDAKMAIREQAINGVDSVPYIMFEGRRRDITLVGAKAVAEYVKALETIIKESS